MRQQFCDALVARSTNPSMLFLTGDLGFMALEPLQKAMGERFINARQEKILHVHHHLTGPTTPWAKAIEERTVP